MFRLSGKIFVDSLPAGLCIGGRENAARRVDRESDGVRLLVTEEGREKEDEKQEKEEGDNDDRTIRKRGGNGGCLATHPERQKPYHGDEPKAFGILCNY